MELTAFRENKKYYSLLQVAARGLAVCLVTGCATSYSPFTDSDYNTVHKLQASKTMVNSVAWSPDGNWLASAGMGSLIKTDPERNNTVRMWDAATGELKLNLQAHADEKFKGSVLPAAMSVAWSPDGKYLVTSGAETIKIWNALDGREQASLQDSAGKAQTSQTVAWSPDQKLIASGTAAGEIVLWDAKSREQIFVLDDHAAAISSVVWSPDGSRLASSSYDKTVRLWDSATGDEVLLLKGHTGYVQTVAWSPDGKMLASGGNDGTVRLWNAASGEEVTSVEANAKPGGPRSPFPGIVMSISWNIDGSTIAFGASDGTVRLINAKSQIVDDILQGHYGEVMSVAWSTDGTHLASSDFNGRIIIWSK